MEDETEITKNNQIILLTVDTVAVLLILILSD